ncbi:MAG: F0F1 ATP synthase subunit delta [Pseudomonadota bacterium]
MAEITTIARPYAKAAFTHAREKNALAQWGNMLAFVSAVVADQRMAALLSRPQLTAAKQAEAVITACGDKLDDAGKNFVRQLCANRRVFALPAIRDQFDAMVAELQKLGDVTVTSAFPMNDAETAKLAASLKRRFAQDVRVSVEVDPALMGGVIVRFGDLVIDASVRGRLNKLASTLNS